MAGKNSSQRRARSALDSMLVHDMKNMHFRLNLLLSNLDARYGDPDFKQSALDLLQSTVVKIESIVGRYAAHREKFLIKVPLDLNDLLQQAIQGSTDHTPIRAPRGRQVRIMMKLGSIPRVWGDPFYLQDAFASLLVNALEAAASSGSLVEIVTGAKTTRARQWSTVEIRDDGAGMSPDFVRDRLFRPFQTTKENGVGLGVYTAKQVMELHQGKLRIDSKPGHGTTVRVFLPATASKGEA